MFGPSRLLVFLWLFSLFVTFHCFVVIQQQGAAPSRSSSPFSKNRVTASQAASDPIIEGLISDTEFERLNQYDRILNQLRRELPLLLQKPLSTTFLTSDIELSVGDSETISLASSREELLRLQQIIILTLRAGNLVQYQPPLIQCQLGISPNNTSSLRLKWRLDIASSPQPPVVFDGESVFQIDGTTIQSLRLESVNFNGQQQDAITIGRFLSSSRNAVQQIQSSPLLQPFLTSLSPLLDTVLSSSPDKSSTESTFSSDSTPIFVVQQVNEMNSTNTTANSSIQKRWVEVNETSFDFPLPGSQQWSQYASFHRRACQFCDKVLPALQDGTVNEACFAKEAYLSTKDSQIKNPRRFYQTLAIGRQQSGAQWQCTGLQALWKENAVRVSYTTSIPSVSIRFRGVDVFEFNNADPVQINKIRQLEFQNEETSTTKWDSALVMRSLAKAVETGRPDTWADFLLLPKPVLSKSMTCQVRSDAAAVTIYRIMERLHVDLRRLPVYNETVVIPVGDFLDETVQLTGYLNETLVKGFVPYSRSVLLAVQSFHAALRSRQIKSKEPPAARIELTETGNVRCTLTLFLQLMGVPSSVKLQIVFEYVVDDDSGKIVQHRLLESRINGQLTPGDVVSRWIVSTPARLEEEDWIRTALDTIQWVRSFVSS